MGRFVLVTRLGALVAILALAACASPKPPQSQPSSGPAARVVALVPSLVEDLFAIGAGKTVVAVSEFSDNVAGARGLPRVADFTSVDTERIVALHADLAVGIPSQARLVEPLRRAGIRVVLIPNDTYADIFGSLRAVGDLTGHRPEANALVTKLQSETASLRKSTRSFVRRPSAFVVLGVTPVWTAGNSSYIATLIGMAGGRNAAAGLGSAYGQYSTEALLHDDPDIIFADPVLHLQQDLDTEPWRSLRAVRDDRVYAIVPPEMLMRPGPNYNEGLRWLIQHFTPVATQR